MSSAKYRNKKVKANGIVYDSKKEYYRHCHLLALEKAGIIKKLERQRKFVLIPAQREPDIIGVRGGIRKGNVIERECAYVADFCYEMNGETIVEDVKSSATKTKDYIIKRKLLLSTYGLRIHEID